MQLSKKKIIFFYKNVLFYDIEQFNERSISVMVLINFKSLNKEVLRVFNDFMFCWHKHMACRDIRQESNGGETENNEW